MERHEAISRLKELEGQDLVAITSTGLSLRYWRCKMDKRTIETLVRGDYHFLILRGNQTHVVSVTTKEHERAKHGNIHQASVVRGNGGTRA